MNSISPFDRSQELQPITKQRISSAEFMRSIRDFEVAEDQLAIWFLGQNGFILKDPCGVTVGIDLYLTNSCASLYSHLPFRLDRQLPIFIEPEDLDVDFFITTHSHDDHADPETIQRHISKPTTTKYIGPWQSVDKYKQIGVKEENCVLLHPNETLTLAKNLLITGTFALPTDHTDLNHIGLLFTASNGITFYNSGDTAHCELLGSLLPTEVDVCAICINGGFHNLSHMQAAHIVAAVRPRVVIPAHYDMMIHNSGSPEMFRVALSVLGVRSEYRLLDYCKPYVHVRS